MSKTAREVIAEALRLVRSLDHTDDVLEALDAAGFVIVPKEPTKEMLNGARDWSIKKNGIGVGNDQATGCYSAMIAAAQEPKP